MKVVAAPDKFRGTASAAAIADAVVRAAGSAGWESLALPMADGGEGMLAVLGGPNRHRVVTGPLGRAVNAGWRIEGDTAFVESALASGLQLAGGREGNRPLLATSAGTGQLIRAAIDAGVRRVVVGLGGSACTDGGSGAVDALGDTVPWPPDAPVEVVVLCDVTTLFLDAARVFGPQKGASPDDVVALTARLSGCREVLRARFGLDPQDVVGGGAAGGLAGALAAAGARLVPGLEFFATHVGLGAAIADADLVVTGEGRFDATSLRGKVVGGVAGAAEAAGVPVLAVVGSRAADVETPFEVVSLTDRHGEAASLTDPVGLVETTVREVLARPSWGSG